MLQDFWNQKMSSKHFLSKKHREKELGKTKYEYTVKNKNVITVASSMRKVTSADLCTICTSLQSGD
jgi:hypothetical protein